MSEPDKMAAEIERLQRELEWERDAWQGTVKATLLHMSKLKWGEAEEALMAKMRRDKGNYLEERRSEYQTEQQEGRPQT